MKNNHHRWWIVGIVAAPFVLMLFLHIGIAVGQYFKIDINVPNIAAADWFMFAGSYLGGAMTLLGYIHGDCDLLARVLEIAPLDAFARAAMWLLGGEALSAYTLGRPEDVLDAALVNRMKRRFIGPAIS